MTDLNRFATWREIHAQPTIWRAWAGNLDVAGLRAWVDAQAVEEVWFCGAGSSAYIGEMIVAALEGSSGLRLRAVATTDLVARPHAYLSGRKPLVVSFGRSGNSAESLGTLDALDALVPDAPRLNITCNGTSALATRPARNQRVVVLPEATHDAGFAMTSSFSTMLLTALAVFDRSGDAGAVSAKLETLSAQLSSLLPSFAGFATASRLPERVVFVGSGPLAFAAREAALKVMELAAGQIPALWDSTLGFRHGPKSFVRGATDIFVFGSADPHAACYDADLVAELRAQFPLSRTTFIGPNGDVQVPTDSWGMLLPVVLAQVLAVVWSERLGVAVDDPFAGQGTLSRVVSGVKLYPVRAR
jgi:tagatose-6-phosphate ketose/aldose isomerase